MALRDLFVRIGLQIDGGQKLEKLDRDLDKTKNSARGLGEALKDARKGLLAVAAAVGLNKIKNYFQGLIDGADALKHQAEMLGLTTQELQKYQFVATITGSTATQVATGFRFFNRVIGESELGTKAANKTLAQLGLVIKNARGEVKPTNELLLEVADKFEKMPDPALRTAYAMRLFGKNGAALIPFLSQGRDAVKEMMGAVDEMGGAFDEAFIQEAHEVYNMQQKISLGWTTLSVKILKELLPVIKEWLRHSIRTVKGLIDMSKHTYALASALRFIPALVGAITVAVLALNTALLPEIIAFGLLAAAVWTTYLAFDDFFTFLRGGDSLIGRRLNALGGDGTAMKVAKQLSDAFGDVAKAFTGASGGIEALTKGFGQNLPVMIEWATKLGTLVVGTLDMFVSGLRQAGALLSGGGMAEFSKIQADFDKRQAALASLREAAGQLTNPTGPSAAERAAADKRRANERFAAEHPDQRVDENGNLVPTGTGGGGAADGLSREEFLKKLKEKEQHDWEMQRTPLPGQDGRGTGAAPAGTQIVNHVQVTVQGVPGDPAATGRAVADGVRKGVANPDTTTVHRNVFDTVQDALTSFTSSLPNPANLLPGP